MQYSIRRISEPAEWPITLGEAKRQVAVAEAITYHDDHLLRLIAAASQQASVRSGRQLLAVSLRLTIDRFPSGSGRILLPYPPLASVESITYLDVTGAEQTLAAEEYRVLADREPGEIALRSGCSWPTVCDEPDAVAIVYTAGRAETAAEMTDEDEWYRQAVLLLVQAYWMRDHQQDFDRLTRAADLILEAHRCGDDFLEYGV